MLAGGCAEAQPSPPPGREPVTLAGVVDGDTIRVRMDGREERVRYIGIDTPERDQRCFVAATQANEALLDDGPLQLEFDVERRDRFGRLLAYVYAGETFVNLELIRQGVADPVVFEPNSRHKLLFRATGRLSRQCGSE